MLFSRPLFFILTNLFHKKEIHIIFCIIFGKREWQ